MLKVSVHHTAASPLDCVMGGHPDRQREQVDNLRAHLREIHGERKRLVNMVRSKGNMCNFEPGDYLLWSRVDK